MKIKNYTIFCLFIPVIFCAILNYYVATKIGGVFIFILEAVCCGTSFLLLRKRGFGVSDCAFIIFLILYSVNIFWSGSPSAKYGLIFYYPIILLSVNISSYYIDNDITSRIVKVSLISVGITTIMTFFVLMQYPNAARVLASSSEEYAQYGYQKYYSMGTANFGLIYSILLLVPATLHLTRTLKEYNNKKIYILLLIVSVFMIGVTLNSAYTIALMLLLVEVILFLFYEMKGKYKTLLLPIFIFVAFTSKIWIKYIIELLTTVSLLFKSGFVQERLKIITEILEGNGSYSDVSRMELYKKAIDSFISSPLIGVNLVNSNKELSGHSTMLDILGGCGLVCFVPYLLFHYYFYKKIKKYLQRTKTVNVWNISTVIYIVLQFINPVLVNNTIVFTYMTIIPCILVYSDHNVLLECNNTVYRKKAENEGYMAL